MSQAPSIFPMKRMFSAVLGTGPAQESGDVNTPVMGPALSSPVRSE